MIPQFVVLVVLLGAVNQGMAACKGKPPMANYTADLVSGKCYLITSKPAFDYQYNELRCGTYYIRSAFPTNFKFYWSFQGSDGITYSISNITNLNPPGTWLVRSGDLTFQLSVIGAIKDKLNIYYACDAQNGKEAVWVYYYKRVNGANEMEDASLQYTVKTLAQNQISDNGFRNVNNIKCYN